MAWAIWLGTALLFALIEIATANFIFLMLAMAALVASVGSFRFDLVGQFLIAITAGLLLLGLLRPFLEHRRDRRTGQRIPSLVGSAGTALEEINEVRGLARINGEIWQARSVNQGSIPHGSTVIVVRSEGPIMVVRSQI